MAKFKKGNEWWKACATVGRQKLWPDPEKLREACYEWVEWVEKNPLKEAIVYQGKLNKKDSTPKMRAMTVGGLCIFLGMTRTTWYEYCKDSAYSDITKEMTEVMTDQKFTGAAAGLLNANIIARDLGLKDISTNEHTGVDGKAIEYKDMTDRDLGRAILFGVAKGIEAEKNEDK